MALVKIISGLKNSGKTTLIKKLAFELKAGGKDVAGFISEAESIRKDAYRLVNLSSGESFPAVGSRVPQGAKSGTWIRYGFSRFYFNSDAFAAASFMISKLNNPESGRLPDVVIIDELGPLELEGGGFFGAVENLLLTYRVKYQESLTYPRIILVVREGLLDKMISKLGIKDFEYEVIYTNQAQ